MKWSGAAGLRAGTHTSREQVEVFSLIGDVALQDGKPKIHAHCVVGRRDGSTRGHLIEAYVRPTLELMLVSVP